MRPFFFDPDRFFTSPPGLDTDPGPNIQGAPTANRSFSSKNQMHWTSDQFPFKEGLRTFALALAA